MGIPEERGGLSKVEHTTKVEDVTTLTQLIDPTIDQKKLVRKIDLYLIPTVVMVYLFCFIDRANIGNARIAGLEKDLGVTGYQYNGVLSVFYISYIIFEIPSNVVCKKVGPGWFIPSLTLLFGISSFGTAFVTNFAELSAVRFILGIFEAGMLPGIAYYLSRWYKRDELAFRLAMYIAAAPFAGAFGGLLASGILKLNSFGSLHSWRMIFAIEGIITCGLAIISFFTMTDRPETARWLTEAEKTCIVERVKAERVGATVLLDKMNAKTFWRGMNNPVVWGVSIIFLLDNITVQGLAFFAPTIVRTIYPRETVIYQQLYTVPPYVVGTAFTLFIPYLSWKLRRRQIFFIISAPFMMVGYIIFLATTNSQARYGATFLITTGAFSFGALSNAQVAANVVSDTSRAAAIGLNVMLGNVGGLISTWAFLPFDGPNYHIGNGLNLGTSSTILIMSIAMYILMKWHNSRRDAREGGDPERLERLDTRTGEHEGEEWKHPSFRWHL